MKVIQKNKKATFDYEILQQYIAGVMLSGPEVKSIRAGNINLKGSYVGFASSNPILKNAHISKYPYDQNQNYDPFRERKLLLNQNEIKKIENALNTQGTTLIPIAVGLVGKYIKIEIAVARGKKKHDKRDTIKSRELKRQTDRLIKNYR